MVTQWCCIYVLKSDGCSSFLHSQCEVMKGPRQAKVPVIKAELIINYMGFFSFKFSIHEITIFPFFLMETLFLMSHNSALRNIFLTDFCLWQKLYAAQDHSLKHQLGKFLGLFVWFFLNCKFLKNYGTMLWWRVCIFVTICVVVHKNNETTMRF